MSQFILPFSYSLTYQDGPDITLPIYLATDIESVVSIDAKLDTGSAYCIFQSRYGSQDMGKCWGWILNLVCLSQ